MKAITVTLTKTKHHSQPWTVLITKPRKEPVRLKQRYACRRNALRGAMRSLNAVDTFGWKHPNYPERLIYFSGLFRIKVVG